MSSPSELLCRQEFSLSAVGFQLNSPPRTLLRSAWPFMSPRFFAFYRVLVAVGLIGWVLIDMSYEFHGVVQDVNRVRIWLTYATNWAVILYSLALLSLALATAYYNFTLGCENVASLPGWKFLWFLYACSITSVATTDIIFWIFWRNSSFVALSSRMAKAKHGLTLILVGLDLFVCAIPVRLLHLIYPACLGLLYIVFTVLVWRFNVVGPDGVGVIYPDIDWSRPSLSLILCVLAFFMMLLTHILLYGLCFLRNGLASLSRGGRFLDSLQAADDTGSEKYLLNEADGASTTTTVTRSSKQRSLYDQLE